MAPDISGAPERDAPVQAVAQANSNAIATPDALRFQSSRDARRAIPQLPIVDAIAA